MPSFEALAGVFRGVHATMSAHAWLAFTPRAMKIFQRRLLDWFGAHRRELPWRASRDTPSGRYRDAYRIWVAEIMLQQTRIAAVMPYYERFLADSLPLRRSARAPQEKC